MNILVLGCSWTAGTWGDTPNWVTSLSELCPHHTFYNCATAGTSLLHSIFIFEEFMSQVEQHKHKIDKVIFQITNEGRLTSYYNLKKIIISEWLTKEKNNLYRLHIDFNHLGNVNYGMLNAKNFSKNFSSSLKLHLFAKSYYKLFTREFTFDLEHKILVSYLKEKTDFLFFHRDPGIIELNNLPCIEKELGLEKFNNFCYDEGKHFNQDGCNWQAHWIKEQLNL